MSIITVCCIGLILILSVNAIFSPDKYTQNNLQAQTSSLQSTAGYSLNSAVNSMISYYDTSFKIFFQNLINTEFHDSYGGFFSDDDPNETIIDNLLLHKGTDQLLEIIYKSGKNRFLNLRLIHSYHYQEYSK